MNGGQQTRTPRWPLWILVFVLGALVLASLGGDDTRESNAPEISYTRFARLVEEERISEVTVRDREVEGELSSPQPIGPQEGEVGRFQTRVPSFGETRVLSKLEEQDVPVHVESTDSGNWRWMLLFLPWLLILGLFLFGSFRMARRMGNGNSGGLAGLGQTRAKRVQPEASKTRFEDVAGQDAAKRDVAELVEYLRDPKRYRKLGADVPHGILMVGPPGTGKTLMARALAGEAGVPFFQTSGSEFIEMVVGVGAARVRRTFEEAKKHQPSILFIDEIDAIGRQRGTGMGGGHDEREQTLNQILDEMDGFTPHESVIVVAATNRPDVLDPALQRPGRFDRRLTLELPGRAARRAIMEIHARNVPLAGDVQLDEIAAAVPGFSGAHLQNLVNEAAMLAAREHGDQVHRRHFDEARDKVIMGPERPLAVTEEERNRLAVHESGHTSVAHYLDHTDPTYKVTIIPRGQALGGTHQLPASERYTMDERTLRDQLTAMMGGRAAERVFLANVSTGADDDIRKATQLARSMVTRWGMSVELGPVDLRDSDENPFLGLEMAKQRAHSDTTAHQVDCEVKRLLEEAEQRALRVIRDNRRAIERLIAGLQEHETLDRHAIKRYLGSPGGGQSEQAA